MPSFPDSAWFLTLGQLMLAEGELFRRLGYAETRFAVRVVPNNMSNGGDQIVGLVIDGYQLTEVTPVADLNEYDPDFVICGKREIWDRMLGEIEANGRPELRHTLSSLALVVGRDLKAFGVLTRKNEQLSEVAAAFVGHLHCNVAMPATAATKPAKAGALQRAGQKAPTPNAASAR